MATVNELKKIVENNREQREAYIALHKVLEERATEIRQAPPHAILSFFCETCQLDCEGEGTKEIRTPAKSAFFAFYRGFCPEGHLVIRRITDRLGDPYFFKSPFVRKQQALYADEVLTPRDPRFKDVYPEAWAQIREREEAGMEHLIK